MYVYIYIYMYIYMHIYNDNHNNNAIRASRQSAAAPGTPGTRPIIKQKSITTVSLMNSINTSSVLITIIVIVIIAIMIRPAASAKTTWPQASGRCMFTSC